MADNILESYFVKVAAIPDGTSFLKLASTLKVATSQIDGLVGTGIAAFVKFESASIATFSAISLGMIGLADKAAMADQSYRLLGLRMLMTKESARAFQQALDAVGVSQDEAAYDPESNQKVQYAYEQFTKLGKAMGSTYEENMRQIRDLRLQYKLFGTEFEMFSYDIVGKIFEKAVLAPAT